jgi:sporulation protein YlmC with PRC-barrel domain
MLAGSTRGGAAGGPGSTVGGSTAATQPGAGSTIGGTTSGGRSATGTSTLATGSSAGVGGLSGGTGSRPGSSAAGIDTMAERGGVSARPAGEAEHRGARIVGDQTSDHDGPGPRLMTAETLIGNQVINHQGDTLGEIEDIMLDVPNGRIAYAVMVAGGFLGMGEKMFALPWSALTLDTTRKCFILDADKQRIQNAPGFDADHWPSQADRQWQEEVHTYYQARPYYDE